MRHRGSVKFTSVIGMLAEVKDGEMSVGSNDLCVSEGSVIKKYIIIIHRLIISTSINETGTSAGVVVISFHRFLRPGIVCEFMLDRSSRRLVLCKAFVSSTAKR